MADGLLLKPDRPAVNIDSTWIQRTIGSGGPIGIITLFLYFLLLANRK